MCNLFIKQFYTHPVPGISLALLTIAKAKLLQVQKRDQFSTPKICVTENRVPSGERPSSTMEYFPGV
jgi:hypothetical protein